ncbi:hypothetical protein MPER_11178, partial [Moniliophthora perniciosa FA553]
MLVACKAAPALAAGNTVPSEISPLTALKLASFINEAGFPPGVVNIVNGYGSTVGEAMSYHNDIRLLSFTGSTLTGRRIQEAAAKSNLKVVHLELGGKALKWSSNGIFFNMGQACIAGSRIYVQEGIYDRFVEGLSQSAKYLLSRTGDPFAQEILHGPQASQLQYDRVIGYINSAKTEGATIHTGGERAGTDGYFIQPTIITDATPGMKVVKEEIFGPVACVIKFKTEEEAIEMANDTSYGLACGVSPRTTAEPLEWHMLWRPAWLLSTATAGQIFRSLLEVTGSPGMLESLERNAYM